MPESHVCEWRQDFDEPAVWDTDCRRRHRFHPLDGSPWGASFEWCPYCGGRIVERLQPDSPYDEDH